MLSLVKAVNQEGSATTLFALESALDLQGVLEITTQWHRWHGMALLPGVIGKREYDMWQVVRRGLRRRDNESWTPNTSMLEIRLNDMYDIEGAFACSRSILHSYLQLLRRHRFHQYVCYSHH